MLQVLSPRWTNRNTTFADLDPFPVMGMHFATVRQENIAHLADAVFPAQEKGKICQPVY